VGILERRELQGSEGQMTLDWLIALGLVFVVVLGLLCVWEE
jgi:predicted Kef-type K+ transport protein